MINKKKKVYVVLFPGFEYNDERYDSTFHSQYEGITSSREEALKKIEEWIPEIEEEEDYGYYAFLSSLGIDNGKIYDENSDEKPKWFEKTLEQKIKYLLQQDIVKIIEEEV